MYYKTDYWHCHYGRKKKKYTLATILKYCLYLLIPLQQYGITTIILLLCQ